MSSSVDAILLQQGQNGFSSKNFKESEEAKYLLAGQKSAQPQSVWNLFVGINLNTFLFMAQIFHLD